MDNPVRVSIVVPVYNSEKYLSETINSVLQQTYNYWELLLVNDGSTDDSMKIIERFCSEDSRIKLLNKKNGGQGSARNLGIKNACGEYIAFLDSDDLWSSDKLEIQVNFLDQSSDVDVCFSQGVDFSASNEEVIPRNTPVGAMKVELFQKELYERSPIINSSVMVRRSILLEDFLFDESLQAKGVEDWDLWLRIALNGNRFAGLDERLVNYRIHDLGIHLNKVRMFEGKIYVYSKYKHSHLIPKWIKLKQWRYVYREIIGYYFDKGDRMESIKAFKEFSSIDRFGLGTFFQKIAFYILPFSAFIWVSKNFIYRVAFRIEYLYYYFKK